LDSLAFREPITNLTNTGNTDLKLYRNYSPPNHLPGTLQKTQAGTKDYTPKGSIEVEPK